MGLEGEILAEYTGRVNWISAPKQVVSVYLVDAKTGEDYLTEFNLNLIQEAGLAQKDRFKFVIYSNPSGEPKFSFEKLQPKALTEEQQAKLKAL